MTTRIPAAMTSGLEKEVERGSNPNGSWVKFAGGLMVCRHTITSAQATGTTGGVFTSGPTYAPDWTFPQSFISLPSVTVSVPSAGGWGNAYAWSPNAAAWRRFSSTSSATSVDCELTAIGFYK